MNGNCDICQDKGDVKHLSIYARGSEGVNVCENCAIKISEYVRHLISISASSFKRGWLSAKEVEKKWVVA